MNDSNKYTKHLNAFNTSLELWKLASQQIYSRFSAMLTAHSIIIAVIGLAITNSIVIPEYLSKWLIGVGWGLCGVWAFFIVQGIRVEQHYRKKAESYEIEVIPEGKEVLIRYKNYCYRGFSLVTYFTIALFLAIYIVAWLSL